MKPKINEVKYKLLKKNYLYDKTIDINNISSGKKYDFICDKGHIFDAYPCNAFQNKGEFGCPICSGRRVLKGYNDLFTTHYELACLLKNKEDGYMFNAGSNKKLFWICPDCGNEIYDSPNKMTQKKHICQKCNFDTSYGEKFVSNLLSQFLIHFEKEKIFDWSDNKKYDFYLEEYNCIIEVNGKQHYTSSDFSGFGGRSYIEEQYNDLYKMDLAKEHGKIKNYYIIDCRYSLMSWIKHNIIISGLLETLYIHYKSVDWEECNKYATSNITKKICESYNENNNINILCEQFDLCYNSIIKKLKRGTELNWCNYDPLENLKSRDERNKKWIIENMSKQVIQMDNELNEIAVFPSIQEAQRRLKISHIWDCITGKRKSAGGYKWKYK